MGRALRTSATQKRSEARGINRELYKRNAELAVRNKTLALLRRLDEISLRSIGVRETADQIAQSIAIEFGYELVSVAVTNLEKKELHWLAFASSVPQYATIVSDLVLNIKLSVVVGHVVCQSIASNTVSGSGRPEPYWKDVLKA